MYTFICEFLDLELNITISRTFEIDLTPYDDQREIVAWKQCAVQALEYAIDSGDCLELSAIKLLSC